MHYDPMETLREAYIRMTPEPTFIDIVMAGVGFSSTLKMEVLEIKRESSAYWIRCREVESGAIVEFTHSINPNEELMSDLEKRGRHGRP